jgi:hypothetical protein
MPNRFRHHGLASVANTCRRFATSMTSITAPAWLPAHTFASEPAAAIEKHRFGIFFKKTAGLIDERSGTPTKSRWVVH